MSLGRLRSNCEDHEVVQEEEEEEEKERSFNVV